MKKILGLTLVLLFLLAGYALAADSAHVFVGGTELVVDENASVAYAIHDASGAVTTTNASAENYTIKLELKNGVPTLNLNNAVIKNDAGDGISADGDIVIRGSGTNAISGNTNAIKAKGSIALSGTFGDISGGSLGGIYSTGGNILIAEDAVIGDISSDWYTIQTDAGSITINGKVGNVSGVIAITSEYNHDTTIAGEIGNISGSDYGIFAYKNLVIADGAKIGDVSGGLGGMMAVGNISIHGAAGGISGGTHGIYAMNGVDISGSISDVEGQCAIRAISGDISINGDIGSVAGNGGVAGNGSSYGIRADAGKVSINSVIGPVSAASNGSDVALVAIRAHKGIEIPDDIIIVRPASAYIDMQNGVYTIFDAADDTIAELVVFAHLSPVPETGDGANLILWMGMMGISMIGIIFIFRRMKREY